MYTGLNNLGLNSISSVFSPTNLFINNEQGFLYINDISTMYQDSAGTIPAALEQPVGLWLDSRFGGVRGATEMAYAGYATPAANDNGTTVISATAFSQTPGATSAGRTYLDLPTVANQWYEVTCMTTGPASGNEVMYARDSAGGAGTILAASSQVIAGPATAQRLIFRATGPTSSLLWSCSVVGTVCSVSSISIRQLPGNHATQPTSANRPTLKQDAKGNYYVHFNGTNQWMQTGSVDFTGTDKMTVFAGVTKLSDAAAGIILELGNAGLAANPGSLSLGSSGSNGIDRLSWFAELRGTLPLSDGGQRSRQPRTYAAPSSAVLSGLYDLAGTSAATDIAARIGGAVATCFDSGNDPGGGNLSNAAFTIGARAGASLFLNGDIYCLSARGAQTTDSLIAQMEQWANGRMGRVY